MFDTICIDFGTFNNRGEDYNLQEERFTSGLMVVMLYLLTIGMSGLFFGTITMAMVMLYEFVSYKRYKQDGTLEEYRRLKEELEKNN